MREGPRARASLLAGLAALSCLAAACVSPPPAEDLPILPYGGDFTLTDHNGEPFDLRSLRGRVVLIFFGYSFCPDACPITLSKLATARRRLAGDWGDAKVLYITVDPERDTPDVLKADLQHFDLDALGLTGTRAEIDKVVELYGAAYEITPTPGSAAKYAVAHTTWLYALDGKGRLRLRFPYEAPVEEVVEGIRAIRRGERLEVESVPENRAISLSLWRPRASELRRQVESVRTTRPQERGRARECRRLPGAG